MEAVSDVPDLGGHACKIGSTHGACHRGGALCCITDRVLTMAVFPLYFPCTAGLPLLQHCLYGQQRTRQSREPWPTDIMIKFKTLNGDAFRVPASASDTVGELERRLLIAHPDLFGNNRDMQIVFDSADPPEPVPGFDPTLRQLPRNRGCRLSDFGIKPRSKLAAYLGPELNDEPDDGDVDMALIQVLKLDVPEGKTGSSSASSSNTPVGWQLDFCLPCHCGCTPNVTSGLCGLCALDHGPLSKLIYDAVATCESDVDAAKIVAKALRDGGDPNGWFHMQTKDNNICHEFPIMMLFPGCPTWPCAVIYPDWACEQTLKTVSALHMAVSRSFPKTTKVLLDGGADVYRKHVIYGFTALAFAKKRAELEKDKGSTQSDKLRSVILMLEHAGAYNKQWA